jgi:hypothetical protein
MEEIIEHLLGNQATTALLSLPKPCQKNIIKSPINFAPSPSSRFQSPFLHNTRAEWGTGKMGDFPLKHPAQFYFFSVFGEHILP